MSYQPTAVRSWGPLILRLGVGVIFIMHGYPKLFPAGPEGFAGFLRNLAFPAPTFFAWIVGIVEFFGGIVMILGLFVRYVGVLMAIEMLVTSVRVKMPGGVPFISPKGTGWELDFLLFMGALALVFLGAGALSLDGLKPARSRLP